jgi:hypothetical protein
MRRIAKDPLLTAAKIGTVVVRVFLVIGMIGIGVGAAVTVVAPGLIEKGLVESARSGSTELVLAGVLAALVVALFTLGLVYDFVTRLAAIIASVGEGEPFAAVNAARLNRMAWVALAIQGLAVIGALLSAWLKPQFAEGSFEIRSEFSLTGVGLAVVLFILARVFRQGAAMREELEGTV